jgi:hypothetical protein
MRRWLVALLAGTVAACTGGGETAARSGPNDLAAQACEEAAKSRLSGKPYELDFAALSASMKDQPGGEKFLTAPILIEPGLTSEVKQIVECTVRFTEGNPNPDVVGFVFNW